MTSIKVNELTVCLKGAQSEKNALARVSFQLCEGDRAILIGEEESGKSMLLKVLAGWIRPTSGRVEVSGSVVGFFDFMSFFDTRMLLGDSLEFWLLSIGCPRKSIDLVISRGVAFSGVDVSLKARVGEHSKRVLKKLAWGCMLSIEGVEILLLETLPARMDAEYQAKCLDALSSLLDKVSISLLEQRTVPDDVPGINKCVQLSEGRLVRCQPMTEFSFSASL